MQVPHGRGRRWRLAAALALAVAAAVVLAACGGDSSSNGSATSGGDGSSSSQKTYRVALVPGISPFPYFDMQARGAIEQAKKYGNIKVEYATVPQYDAKVQTRTLDAVLATKPDFLLVSPDDNVALRPAIQRFMNAGIPVITVGGALKDRSGLVAAIQTDNYQGGQLVGDALGRLAGGRGSAAVINIQAGDSTLDDRVRGFADTIEQKYPNIKVLPTEYGGGDASGSLQKMRSLLLANPDITSVFGVAEVTAEGAAAAIKAVGKTGEIPVAAFDASPAEVTALQNGTIQFLSVSQPAKQAALAIDYVHEWFDGDRAKIKQFTMVPNVGVDRENLDTPEAQAVLYRTLK